MDWKAQKILVTGATGFLGSHLTKRLVEEGAQVYAWASSKSHLWRIQEVESKLHFSVVDIRNLDRVKKPFRRFNRIWFTIWQPMA